MSQRETQPQVESIRLTEIPDNPDVSYNKLIHTFLNYIQNDVTEIKKTVQQLVTDNIELENKLTHTEKRLSLAEGQVTQLQTKVAAQDAMITDLKCRSMRDNLVIKGINEGPQETWEDTKQKVTNFMKNALKMPNVHEDMIDRAHRSGTNNAQGPRQIIAKFRTSTARNSVFQYVKNLKDHKNLSVQEQFPPEVQEQRKRLWPKFKEAKSDPRNKVKWATDKLIINGKAFSAKDDDQQIDPTTDVDSKIKVYHTEHTTVDGNVFVGHSAKVSKESEIPQVLAALLKDRVYAGANHTMYAYRTGRTNNMKESCKDDGEHGGGSALLKQMKDQNTTNTIIIVSRWLGNHLGPRRFDIIKGCAEEANALI